MGAQGTTTVDFGAFPGSNEATVAVTGQASIIGSSLAEAWLWPVATADHSIDEHYAESPNFMIIAMNVVAGVGFTIAAIYQPFVLQPLEFPNPNRILLTNTTALINQMQQPTVIPSVGGATPRTYGLWTVAWVWN